MLIASDAPLVLVGALLIDAVLGDPDRIWRRLPHPVVWFGWAIAQGDRLLNRKGRSGRAQTASGIVLVLLLVGCAAAAGWLVETAARSLPAGQVVLACLASVLLAGRSLYDHVRRVELGFARGGLLSAREAVSMIVGRDPDTLDGAGIARAAIESTAENFADGVVAPAFWFALLGLPGLAAYKAINTADSMIGHRSLRYRDFGWAAARLDDLVNLVPARLSGVLVALAAPAAGGRARRALAVMWRDARLHRSPNAGWPESAMAAGLGLALAGPRVYASGRVDDPFLNPDGRRDAAPADIGRALRVLVAASALQIALYGVLALSI